MSAELQCPTCAEPHTIVEDWHSGTRVCSSCGLVVEEIIDEGGIELLGNYTRACSTVNHDRLLDTYDRGLDTAGLTVSSTVVRLATGLFNRVPGVHRGHRRTGIEVACLCEAMRTNGYTPDVTRLAAAFGVPVPHVFGGMQILVEAGVAKPVNTDSVVALAVSFANALRLDFKFRLVLEHTCDRAERSRRSIRELRAARPASLAAGCLWHVIVTNGMAKTVTRNDVQRVTNVAKSTFNAIQRHIKDIAC